MATIMVGSARSDERGKISGGTAGDQKQTSSTNDTKGELSMQPMYTHSKGWYIVRPKEVNIANKMAEGMKIACNNPNIGYDQGQRGGIVTNGVNSKVKTEADCGTTVRACCKYAGFDPGNFSTADEADVLEKSGKFEKRISYVSQAKTPVYDGDVLVTKTKGHTVIVVSGNPRKASAPASAPAATTTAKVAYYPKYTGKSDKIDEILKAIGAPYGNVTKRKPVATANGISGYKGTYEQNTKINTLAKSGKLKK